MVVIAPQGATLAAGAIARVAVPDVRRAADYIAIVNEVAAPSYALQNPSVFSLAVARP